MIAHAEDLAAVYRAARQNDPRFLAAEAAYGYVLNLLRLKQAAGTLSEEDVVQVNGWLR